MAKILVAEDDGGARNGLRLFLRLQGFEVTTVSNGTEALAACEGQEFDLIITDYLMPGINGMILLSQLREKQIKTPVILVGGTISTFGAKEILRERDFAAVLPKPFDVEDLGLTIRAILAQEAFKKEKANESNR